VDAREQEAQGSLEQVDAYLGMTPDMLWKRYGHHHPEFQKDAAEWR